jgi:hypothetical protein
MTIEFVEKKILHYTTEENSCSYRAGQDDVAKIVIGQITGCKNVRNALQASTLNIKSYLYLCAVMSCLINLSKCFK